MSKTIVQKLAEFSAATTYENLPAPVVDTVKASFIDTIGCMLYGCTTEQGKILKRAAYTMRTQDGAGVVGESWKVNPPLACYLNGAMAGSMAFDDLHHKATTHCGCVGVPAALACLAASPYPVSGKEFIAALTAAAEVMIRVTLSIMPAVRLRGYHPASVVGGFGGAVAAAKIMNLDATGITNAIGIGGGVASGLMSAQMTSMIHGLQAPNSAMQGVYAAFWAREGLIGTDTLFEEHYGSFPSAVAGGYDEKPLLEGLGEQYEAAGIGIKYYPTAGSVSSALGALTNIMQENGLNKDQIQSITIKVNKAVFLHCGFDYTPGPAAGAQMSIQYCLAALLVCGKVGAEQFTDYWIHSPEIAKHMALVNVVHDPAMDDLGPSMGYLARANVVSTTGQEYAAEVVAPKGSAQNKMTEAEVVAKYMDQASAMYSEDKAKELAETILTCETIKDMRMIGKLLYL